MHSAARLETLGRLADAAGSSDAHAVLTMSHGESNRLAEELFSVRGRLRDERAKRISAQGEVDRLTDECALMAVDGSRVLCLEDDMRALRQELEEKDGEIRRLRAALERQKASSSAGESGGVHAELLVPDGAGPGDVLEISAAVRRRTPRAGIRHPDKAAEAAVADSPAAGPEATAESPAATTQAPKTKAAAAESPAAGPEAAAESPAAGPEATAESPTATTQSPKKTAAAAESPDATPSAGGKVEADYRGQGTYYPGTVARDRGDGTYDIDYDDGEKETGVARDLIKAQQPTAAGDAADAAPAAGAPAGPEAKVVAEIAALVREAGGLNKAKLLAVFERFEDPEGEIDASAVPPAVKGLPGCKRYTVSRANAKALAAAYPAGNGVDYATLVAAVLAAAFGGRGDSATTVGSEAGAEGSAAEKEDSPKKKKGVAGRVFSKARKTMGLKKNKPPGGTTPSRNRESEAAAETESGSVPVEP